MSVQQQEIASSHEQGTSAIIRQNLTMAAAGFLMAGTIIGAGIGGLALGHMTAAPATTPAAYTTPITQSAQGRQGTMTTAAQAAAAASIAITIRSDMAHPDVYRFSPGAITVRAGTKVTLTFSNPGMAMHGIAIAEFGVNTMIQPASGGQPSTAQVSFTPTKPGTYTAHCTVYCGSGHARMILHIRVLA